MREGDRQQQGCLPRRGRGQPGSLGHGPGRADLGDEPEGEGVPQATLGAFPDQARSGHLAEGRFPAAFMGELTTFSQTIET